MAGKGRILIPGLYDSSDESGNDDGVALSPADEVVDGSDVVVEPVTPEPAVEDVAVQHVQQEEEDDADFDSASVETAEEPEEVPAEEMKEEEEEEEYDPNDVPFLIRKLQKPVEAGEEAAQQSADETLPLFDQEEEREEADQENNYFVVDVHNRCLKILPGGFYSEKEFQTLEKISAKEFAHIHERVRDPNPDDDDHFHCELCVKTFRVCCPQHPFYRILDRAVTQPIEDRAKKTAPAFIRIKTSSIPNAGLGAFTATDLPVGLVFGPYQGILSRESDDRGYTWEIRNVDAPSQFLDGGNPRYSNWMRYINSPRFDREQNLVAFQYNGQVFYRVIKPINAEQELLVWYGAKYGESLGVFSTKRSTSKARSLPKEIKNPFIM